MPQQQRRLSPGTTAPQPCDMVGFERLHPEVREMITQMLRLQDLLPLGLACHELHEVSTKTANDQMRRYFKACQTFSMGSGVREYPGTVPKWPENWSTGFVFGAAAAVSLTPSIWSGLGATFGRKTV